MSKIALTDTVIYRVLFFTEALLEYCRCKEELKHPECEWVKKVELLNKNKSKTKIEWKLKNSEYYLVVHASLKTLRDIVRAKYNISDNLGEKKGQSMKDIVNEQDSANGKPINNFPITYDLLNSTLIVLGYKSDKNPNDIDNKLDIIVEKSHKGEKRGSSWRTLEFHFPDKSTDDQEKILNELKQCLKADASSKNDKFNYDVAYIPMKPPENENNEIFKRKIDLYLLGEKAKLAYNEAEKFLEKEYEHRKKAYAQISTEELPESLLDDRDMNGDYSLFVVYKKVNSLENIALLTTRVFTNKNDIKKEICGDTNKILVFSPEKQSLIEIDCKLPHFEEGEIFVIDRLSSTYIRENRDELYGMLFRKIYDVYKNGKIKYAYALARRDEEEYLLCKYVRLGMKIEGQRCYKLHRNFQHWVLSTTIEDMKKNVISSYRILQTAKIIR